MQCTLGPFSSSSIFCEEIISSESVPAGLFIKILADAILSSGSTKTQPIPLLNCLDIIHSCKDIILTCITLPCPDPAENAFFDPRPTIAESWFLLMNGLMETGMIDNAIESILIDTCVAFVSLLYNPSMAKTIEERRRDPGMSLDGPQSRTGILFLENFFLLGFRPLQIAGQKLASIVQIDNAALHQWCGDQQFYGIAIIGASLFRANQGSLPPWAVESIPDVYSAFFHALNSDAVAFVVVIRLSMEIRLSPDATAAFGMVQRSQLLSGRYFGSMSEKGKSTFLDEVTKLCQKNDNASWRRMKAIVKQACGGKKKETDFGQKPALTKWEFFRT